jgi:hypothetical protein
VLVGFLRVSRLAALCLVAKRGKHWQSEPSQCSSDSIYGVDFNDPNMNVELDRRDAILFESLYRGGASYRKYCGQRRKLEEQIRSRIPQKRLRHETIAEGEQAGQVASFDPLGRLFLYWLPTILNF